jgi:hypothetical protein
MLVQTKPEFRNLSESAVLAALDDPDPKNPIAIEAARLVAAYTDNVQQHVRLGGMPFDMLRVKAHCPIEEIAMRLASDAFREAGAQTL